MNKNKLIARAYIMGRYGMLQCTSNLSDGYGGNNCKKCHVVDNKSHGINHCPEWSNINLVNLDKRIDYDLIHAEC